jgi:DNA-directed RNA polymerase subunit RPC12/RpoP
MKQIVTGLDQSLMEVAASVCAKEHIDLSSLDARSIRGLVFYWCSSCSRIYPLTELCILPRRVKCGHCNEKVKLYTNSNKFGKLRRSILYKLLDMGLLDAGKKKRM